MSGKVALWKRIPQLFYKYIVQSILDTLSTIFKSRKGRMRTIIFVQLFIYGCYKFSNANFTLTYLYMKRFASFDLKFYVGKCLWVCLGCSWPRSTTMRCLRVS